jgi:hypothetical protein
MDIIRKFIMKTKSVKSVSKQQCKYTRIYIMKINKSNDEN